MVFLKVLKGTKRRERELRLLLLGLDNAGKTTFVRQLNGEPTDTIPPTLGFNIKTLEYLGYQLNIWDVGGQKTIRAFWKNYFEETDGLVWVVDSADITRLDDCRNELNKLLIEERLAGASLLILANKSDMKGALSADEIRNALDLDSITTHHWQIQSCSAKKGYRLFEGLDWLINDISSRIHLLD